MGASESGPLLEVRGLARRFRQGDTWVEPLAGLDLELQRGQTLAITGRSGCGKSTLLHLLGGLDVPDAGEILWSTDASVWHLAALDDEARTRFRRTQLGFVFQFFELLPTLSAQENVALLAELNGRDSGMERAAELLASLGMSHRMHARPATLSGGERQRVAIARALVHEPVAILADEPTGNLDATTGSHVLEALQGAVDAHGTALILVTHDAGIAGSLDRQIRLQG